MKKQLKKNLKPVIETVETIEDTVDTVVSKTDKIIDPARQSVARRYPTLFLLAVAFVVAAVAHGFNGLIENISVFAERPHYVLLLGIGILVVTGRFYKKLS